MKRYYIIFKGRVQGVGFRYTVQCLASVYHLTGWIENMPNGNVQMEIQGSDLCINKMLRQLISDKGFIRIDDYQQKSLPLKADESKFFIRY